MKIFTLTAFIIAFSSGAHAADITSRKSSNQPKVAEKKASSAFSTVPFDMTAEKLPENYQGHSVFEVRRKLAPHRPRGEFEKSEEYEARIARWYESPFLGSITPADILAFEIMQEQPPAALSVKYDADKEEMTATISFENQYLNSGRARWLEIFYHSTHSGSHIGVTRMGVKFRVSSHEGKSYGLGFKEQLDPISISMSYSRDKAVEVKHLVRAYAIATLVEPYKIDYSKSTTASLDNPSEWLTDYRGLWLRLKAVWLVNFTTGEVLAKLEAPFPECKYGIC